MDSRFSYLIVYSFDNYGFTNCSPNKPILEDGVDNNSINIAIDALQKYGAIINATYINRLVPLIDRITDPSKDQIVVHGNVTLELTAEDGGGNMFMNFKHSVEGLPSTYLGVTISVSKLGYVTSLTDSISLFKIGSTSVKVTENEAVQIALENASQWLSKLGAKIVKNETSLCLYRGRGDDYTLYPYWHVMLTFDKIYPGNAYGYYVGIWADTGEIASGTVQLEYGSQQKTVSPWLAVPPIAIATLIAIFAYRKRRKNH